MQKQTYLFILFFLLISSYAFCQADTSWNKLETIIQPQTCFKVYRLKPNIYAIREFADFEDVNCYLIIGSKAAVLFDTGLGIGNIKKIVDDLTALPVIVINSHTHYDHINGNYLFATVKIMNMRFSLQNAAGMEHNDFVSFYQRAYLVSDISAVHIPEDYFIHPFLYKGFIKGSESIDLGGIKLKIIATPGHTPDAICLLDEYDRLLFSGDTIYKGSIFLHLPDSDFNNYVSTVAQLNSMGGYFDFLMPAHGATQLHASCIAELYKDVEGINNGKEEYSIKNGIHFYDKGFFKFLVK